ncbi:14427_t:CDS:2 [Funneliformis geosporum]|uniref:1239_t:CDS:1 n=1 Tax=Funneliformis geosporum TaxID=1117311 RepID=A0A9W4WRK7_9GLOM|nr:1239_t:CDS:2 [Funneliformis geosporum]CAI2192153.1 14427_t:CDS:2 [Funneliformis geosporum]
MQDQAISPIMIEDDDDNQSNSVDNRTLENQANSNDKICATNIQDNLKNQFNVNSRNNANVQESES